MSFGGGSSRNSYGADKANEEQHQREHQIEQQDLLNRNNDGISVRRGFLSRLLGRPGRTVPADSQAPTQAEREDAWARELAQRKRDGRE